MVKNFPVFWFIPTIFLAIEPWLDFISFFCLYTWAVNFQFFDLSMWNLSSFRNVTHNPELLLSCPEKLLHLILKLLSELQSKDHRKNENRKVFKNYRVTLALIKVHNYGKTVETIEFIIVPYPRVTMNILNMVNINNH